MALSQNGFIGIADYGDPRLISNPTVPGTNVKVMGGLLAGPVAVVLLYVAGRFDNEVETLVQSQGIWGFEPRDIRGSTVLSNHASGTAIDLNSALHPLGAAGTFTAAKVAAIRRILDACGGLIRWGGNYDGRKDEMHFEANGSGAQLAILAGRLVTGGIPTAATGDWFADLTPAGLTDAIITAIG